ncbi:MAG: glycoside hydrolase family 66 protein [Maledivibacter sp.]|jgi:dextranase|nr:glycoside hydrolase family 66 protein [Maledivibacter sp.]
MENKNSLIKYISDVFPEKGQFLAGEPIVMVVEFPKEIKDRKELNLEIKIMFLDEVTEVFEKKVELPYPKTSLNLNIPPKNDEFKGYGVDINVYDKGGSFLQKISSSFDVVDNWRRSTRYGFLSDFYTEEKDDMQDLENMRKFHINLVQFYDWMYRHDDLIPKSEEFQDLMGRSLNLGTVKSKINTCHRYGMKAIAYGAVYAASEAFYKEHRDWALYNSSGRVVDFIGKFYIMNISEKCGWHRHIINEYKKAIKEVDFDGIHMDTYGFPKRAISKINDVERVENLEEHFPILINNTRNELEKVKDDICLIFNNVGNWPVDTVARAEQDAMYIEVWDPYERYGHLKKIIDWAKTYSGNKPVILAAYLRPYIDEAHRDIEKANMAALLATSVIAANGAYHLILGEKNGVLTQGYYVDYSTLDDNFVRQIRNYYDYIIRYSNLLFDHELRDVSMTHICGDNLEYVFENVDISTYGEADKVWIIVKEKPIRKVINFINLKGNDDYWNKGKNKVEYVNDITLKIQIESKVKSVFITTPDQNMGRPQKLKYTILDGDRGKNLVVKVDQIKIWSTLVVEFEENEKLF